MNFHTLNAEEKTKLHTQTLEAANAVGGKNFFLQLLEEIRKEEQHPLQNKGKAYHYSKGKISWEKSIYKDTLALLQEGLKREDETGDMLKDLSEKKHKNTLNMMRALKPVSLSIKPKNIKDGEGFEVSIFELNEEGVAQTSWLFKVLFFYSIQTVKKVLNHKA